MKMRREKIKWRYKKVFTPGMGCQFKQKGPSTRSGRKYIDHSDGNTHYYPSMDSWAVQWYMITQLALTIHRFKYNENK